MSSTQIPKDNSSYDDINYWNQRYESEDTYDWLLDYSSITHIIRNHVSKDHSILMLGCGNSLLSEQMFGDGFHNIHNIDFCESVITQMSTHCDKCSQMKWSAMDCTRLSFPDESFDVVIEKATIDAMLTTEKSPWRISHQNKSRISLVLREVCRVLKPIKGQFISISFFGPHFRFPLYKSCFEKTPKLSMEAIYELEKNFHYYCYRLVKSLELNEVKSLVPNEVKTLEPNEVKPLEPNEVKPFLYQPPKVITSQTIDHFVDDNNHSNDDHNYIFNINI